MEVIAVRPSSPTWPRRRSTPTTSSCGCTCFPPADPAARRSTSTGIFGLLTNVAWTSAGPCAADGFETCTGCGAPAGTVTVFGVDKFPRMTDYVCPSGVRIADADRVRLGAHLAEGTTVMHEGFVNYNAGTLGTSMVEGRISAGRRRRRRQRHRRRRLDHGHAVRRRQGQVIRSASGCLLGANAGIGISLGDDCVVEAGCYVTAGTQGDAARRRGGQGAGAVRPGRPAVPAQLGHRGAEALPREGHGGALNAALHALTT